MEYGLIGMPLGHSYSKEIHELIADYRYDLTELTGEQLDPFLRRKEFRAINVTIPYKQAVIPYLDEISELAGAIGAVNTIVNRDGRLCGYNTDASGLLGLLRSYPGNLTGKKALILGSGGTSRTALSVLKKAGLSEIYRVSRGARKSGEDTVRTDTPAVRSNLYTISYDEAVQLHSDADLIVNTTPVGMDPHIDAIPIDLSVFRNLSCVLDVIYHPLRTRLILEAQNRGIFARGGLWMLCAQAVYASALFQDREPDERLIETAFRSVLDHRRNLILIGMPSSGKSTIGALLSGKTGKELIDIDDEIIRIIQMPIADFFAQNGEQAFRDLESQVIAKVSRGGGQIIATGGGAVLRQENVAALKQNGFLAFLDRPLEALTATSDRPLSSNVDALNKLYKERYPIYQASCDVRVDASVSPEEVARQVWEAYEASGKTF